MVPLVIFIYDARSHIHQISKYIKTPDVMTIRPDGAELFHADRQTESLNGMKELVVDFSNFANSLKNTAFCLQSGHVGGTVNGLFSS